MFENSSRKFSKFSNASMQNFVLDPTSALKNEMNSNQNLEVKVNWRFLLELSELLMMNANFHFGTLRYPLIMYTILFTYIAHYLNNK